MLTALKVIHLQLASRCLQCTCFGQYKTYLRYFGRCVRDNRLLFFPVGNSPFLIQDQFGKICMTYDELHNITPATCNSSDSLQRWIWTQHSQLLNVETSKCIQQGQAYPGSLDTWYLSLEECNFTETKVTKQQWKCAALYLRLAYRYFNDQLDYMYITFANDLILGKRVAPTVWKRRQFGQTSPICSSSFGCNELTNPTSFVLDTNYQRQGEQQIADLPGTRKCSVSHNQLQFLDYNYWKKLEFKETIFVISDRKSGTFLKWDFTRAPSNWTNLIIRLNFKCIIGSDRNSKCVLIKLKALSDSVQTTKSAPGTPTVHTYYNTTNTGTKAECIDCTTPKSELEEKSTNSIALFFVGGAVTLAIVLVVLVVIFIIYKRRRQAPKLSSSVLAVDAVEMQNRSPGEPSQNNQMVLSVPNCPLKCSRDQGQGYVIPVGETTPGELEYVSPIDGTTPVELEYVTPIDDGTAPYEEVQISPPSVYAELNRNQRDGNDNLYQELLKLDSDYVIPAHTEAEPSYEEISGRTKTPPGYTELDITKRAQDDSAYYQKLIKK